MSSLFRNLHISRRSFRRWHRPLADQYHLLSQQDPYLCNAEGSTVFEKSSFSSGSALAIQKCFYYLIVWHWDHNGFPLLSSNITPSDPQPVMTSGRSTSTHTIPRVENNIRRCTLVVWLSPDGSFEHKFSHHQQQALKWIHNISIAPLSWGETNNAYCMIWHPSF